MEGLDQSKKWRSMVADMKRQVDRVIEIGDVDLAEYAAAAIHDCILEFQQGRLHERDEGQKMAMRLTRNFSRINANGEFLHEENMNLPPQGVESSLEDRPYGREEIHKLFEENDMQDPVNYLGDQYFFTGKIGKSFKDPGTLAFEYSDYGPDYGKDMEQRIWVDTKGRITPD